MGALELAVNALTESQQKLMNKLTRLQRENIQLRKRTRDDADDTADDDTDIGAHEVSVNPTAICDAHVAVSASLSPSPSSSSALIQEDVLTSLCMEHGIT